MKMTPRISFICLLLMVVELGCTSNENQTQNTKTPSFAGVELSVAALEDPALIPALNSQRGEWGASRQTKVNVRPEPVTSTTLEGVDVVVFSSDRLGELVDKGALYVFPESLVRPPSHETDQYAPEAETKPANPPEDTLKFSDLLLIHKDFVTKYGADRFGLPVGSTALVLVMNKHLLEAANLPLKGPKTWRELDELAKTLHTPETAGIAFAFADHAEGVSNATFLARAAAAGFHKDQFSFLFNSDSMEPRVATPPFVESLEALLNLAKFGPKGMLEFDAEAARKAFKSGKVAMLIDRAERAETWAGGFPIMVAQLPGSERVYDPASRVWEEVKSPNRPSYLPRGGGWLVGVTAAAAGKRREAAIDFALYLTMPEISSRVRTTKDLLMLPTRTSQLSQGLLDPKGAAGVDVRAWSDAVAGTLTASRVIAGLRIPDANGYLDDLTKGRIAASKGESAQAALNSVAEAWNKRTESLGRERQLWHYRRSLNTLSTLQQPPAR